jgi:hypothetical protein
MASSPDDDAISLGIDRLLAARQARATICPSEVARDLAAEADSDWRALMPDVRRVAALLVADGRLRVTRGGQDVHAESAGGPIRLGRVGESGAG